MAGGKCWVRFSEALLSFKALFYGCEYMTGGAVVIIGETGRNFAAGMSGGVAYIFDKNNSFKKNCNMEMVSLEKLEEHEDLELVHGLLERHIEYTGSTVAKDLLVDWPAAVIRPCRSRWSGWRLNSTRRPAAADVMEPASSSKRTAS